MTVNVSRVLGLISIFWLLSLSACRGNSDQPSQIQTSIPEVYSSIPPFKTREPERYQAVRTSVFASSTGESQTSRTLLAKDGQLRREETVDAGRTRVVYLDLPDGSFLLLPEARVYASTSEKDESDKKLSDPLTLEDSPDGSLHAGAAESRYQELGQESVSGRPAKKYRVVVNDSPAGDVSNTETLVWVDEELGMPIKSQTTSHNGNRWTMELTEIKREVDKTLFQIPSGYAKVSKDVIRGELEKH